MFVLQTNNKYSNTYFPLVVRLLVCFVLEKGNRKIQAVEQTNNTISF